MAEREKGVATVSCPKCGHDVPAVEQADGSVTGESCSKCYPEAKIEKASAHKKSSREQGTTVQEDS